MGTFAHSVNNEDPDEIPQNATFHQGLHCLIRQTRKKYNIILEIITYGPSIYTMDNPDFIVFSLMNNSIGMKIVKVNAIVPKAGVRVIWSRSC